jgi:hypothetical protein
VTSRLLALLAPLCVLTLAAAEPLPKVPDGFKCEVVLEAPDIEAPTALCVAPNGDVYFAEDPMDMAARPPRTLIASGSSRAAIRAGTLLIDR